MTGPHRPERLGIAELREDQRQAIDALCAGRDVMALLPTGSGKSAIYQLAGAERTGPTLVVSPLLALQRDQIDALGDSQLGGAVALDGTMTRAARRSALAAVADGDVGFLFCTPEQLTDVDLVASLASLEPGLVAIDEAHCISTWGRDFRPAFQQLGAVVERLGRPPVAALTASATEASRIDIAEQLRLDDPLVVRASVVRPGLAPSCHPAGDRSGVADAAVEAAASIDGCVIVYVPRRALTGELASRLDGPGRRALAYHGAMRTADRHDVLHRVVGATEDVVVVATTAFGLGIDAPAIRGVVHVDAPESVDAYYQEIGRAGRDGDGAVASLWWSPRHASRRRFSAGTAAWSMGDASTVTAVLADGPLSRTALRDRTGIGPGALASILAELGALGAVDAQVRSVRLCGAVDEARLAERHDRTARLTEAAVSAMDSYVGTDTCRWQFLAGYFSEATDPCGICDNCRRGSVDPTPPVATGQLAAGAELDHPEFGRGTITHGDDRTVTVSFVDAGTRTLDRAVLDGLLRGGG